MEKQKSEYSKIFRNLSNEVTDLKNTRSLLNDSRNENSKLQTNFEKLQSLMNEKRKEIEQLKSQVAENVNNKNEDDNIKTLYKQLVKKCRTQIKTLNNYTVAAEESKTEIEQLNVTVANLRYDLTQAHEGDDPGDHDNDTVKALNNKIKHLKSEIEGMNNSLSNERIKNEKLKESKTKYTIIPDKKLEDSKKKLSEEVKVLKKSNEEKDEQIVELGCELRGRHSDLDKHSLDIYHMEDTVVRLQKQVSKLEEENCELKQHKSRMLADSNQKTDVLEKKIIDEVSVLKEAVLKEANKNLEKSVGDLLKAHKLGERKFELVDENNNDVIGSKLAELEKKFLNMTTYVEKLGAELSSVKQQREFDKSDLSPVQVKVNSFPNTKSKIKSLNTRKNK